MVAGQWAWAVWTSHVHVHATFLIEDRENATNRDCELRILALEGLVVIVGDERRDGRNSFETERLAAELPDTIPSVPARLSEVSAVRERSTPMSLICAHP